jgi:hypothetical protein
MGNRELMTFREKMAELLYASAFLLDWKKNQT